MTNLHIPSEWKQQLGFCRGDPRLCESPAAVPDIAHAPAVRAALNGDIGLSAVFGVQDVQDVSATSFVPTIGFLVMEEYRWQEVREVYRKLWNQGLLSLLLVITDDTLRAFSLLHKQARRDSSDDKDYLIETLDRTRQALQLRVLILGVESGRLYAEHEQHFNPEQRIDHVLLSNITAAHQLLSQHDLEMEQAQVRGLCPLQGKSGRQNRAPDRSGGSPASAARPGGAQRVQRRQSGRGGLYPRLRAGRRGAAAQPL